MSARTLLLLVTPVLLWGGTAHGQDPYAQIEVEGWTLDRGDAHSGLSLGGRLDLNEAIRLEAFASATPTRSLGYGEVTWGDLRLGAGAIGDDAAVHLGYAPTFDARPHERVWLRGGLDVSMGGALLGGARARESWGADVYAGRVALRGEVISKPWDRLTLSLGAQADITLALAPPSRDPLIATAAPLADRFDLGLLGALSQSAVGAWGQASLEVFRGRPRDDLELRLDLGYREAWDWINLDPTAALLSETEILGDLSPRGTPWRTTRRVSLDLRGSWDDGKTVLLGLDLQHVRGSTTSLEFGDRDGWSLGARLAASLGRVEGAVTGRYHFQSDPLEDYWGAIPRGQAGLELSAVLYEDAGVAVRVVGRGRLTVDDAFGVPREGYVCAAALEIAFGGAPARRVLGRDHEVLTTLAQALPAGPGLLEVAMSPSADGPTLEERALELAREASPDLEALGPDEMLALRERLKDLASEVGLDEQDLRDPEPALVIQKVLRSQRSALVAGYGRGGIRLSPIRRASRYADTERLDPRAADLGLTARWDPSDADTYGAQLKALLGQPSLLEGISLDAFAGSGVEAFSLFAPRGRRYTLVFQGRSAWARFMRRTLTGQR